MVSLRPITWSDIQSKLDLRDQNGIMDVQAQLKTSEDFMQLEMLSLCLAYETKERGYIRS